MNFRSLLKKVCAICFLLLSSIALPAQVMWNVKGGAMPINNRHFNESKDKDKLNWMAGLEIEIPLSTKLNIETGLRYRSETFCQKVGKYDCEDFENHLELPIRLAYKQRLGEKFSLHVGAGPYIGAPLYDELVPENLGVETSVAINWKCLSLGVTYNKICFNTGNFDKEHDFKYKANSGLMLTLGIRFGSRAWKYVGAGLLAAGAVAGTVYAATQGDYSGSNYTQDNSNYSTTSNYLDGNFSNESSSNSDEANFLNDYRKWESNAKDTYNALTNTGYKVKKDGKDVSGSTAQSWGRVNYSEMKKILRNEQKQMKDIRIKASKKGINIPKSEYEDIDVKW